MKQNSQIFSLRMIIESRLNKKYCNLWFSFLYLIMDLKILLAMNKKAFSILTPNKDANMKRLWG